MLDTLLFLTKNTVSNATGSLCTGGVSQIVALAKMVIKVLQIAVPIGLIVMGTIDMAKAVIAGDEKKMKEASLEELSEVVSADVAALLFDYLKEI